MLAKMLLPMLLLLPAGREPPTSNQHEDAQLQASLQHHVQNYSLKANSFLEALTAVAGKFEIPMGIQWVRDDRTLTKVEMLVNDATVYQVIKSIAKTQPGYAVGVSDGVVHVFPRKLAADPRNFLNLKIKRLVAHEELLQLVTIRLQHLVAQTVSPPPPMPPGGGMGFNIGSTPGDKLLTFRLEDVTVEKALDVIASLSSEQIWVVTFCGDCGLTPTGFLQTIGLWSTNSVPSDGAGWDTLRWGDAIPTSALRRRSQGKP